MTRHRPETRHLSEIRHLSETRHLSEMTSPGVDSLEPRPILVVPVGSAEQHGPHLPIGTDTAIAVALSELAVAALDDLSPRDGDSPAALVAPAVAYGASGEHADFTGTLSIGEQAVETLLIEIVRSADSFSGVVLVNGHGGNERAVRRAVALVECEGRRCLPWSPGAALARPAAQQVVGGRDVDAHAGWLETSLMLAVAPESVRLELAEAGDTRSLREVLGLLSTGGVAAVSRNGVLGDPAGASRELGEKLIGVLVADLVASIDNWAHAARAVGQSR